MPDPLSTENIPLPRLPSEEPEWWWMQAWWQRVVEQIEATVPAVNGTITEAEAAQADATQALADAAAAQGTADGAVVDAAAAQFDATAALAALAALPTFAFGTYTPTLTNVTNVAASTAGVCLYLRLGDIVIVCGQASMTPTASGASTVLGISLPIASAFTASTNAGGVTAAAGVQQSGAIEADATNDRAQMRLLSTTTGGFSMFFIFGYRII